MSSSSFLTAPCRSTPVKSSPTADTIISPERVDGCVTQVLPLNFISCVSARPGCLRPSCMKVAINHLKAESPASTNQSKNVRFEDPEVVGTVERRSTMPIEDQNLVWYQSHELSAFKEEAKDLCRRNTTLMTSTSCRRDNDNPRVRKDKNPKQRQDDETTISLPYPSTSSDDSSSRPTDSVRGMERVCIRRQRNKLLAERCILKAQAKNRNPDFIASISLKCTVYAKQVAEAQAMIDYCDVYYPHLVSSLPQLHDLPQHPFPIKMKLETALSAPTSTSSVSKERINSAPQQPTAQSFGINCLETPHFQSQSHNNIDFAKSPTAGRKRCWTDDIMTVTPKNPKKSRTI